MDVFIDRDANQSNGNEIFLATGVNVPAGSAGIIGTVVLDTTNVTAGSYRVFGRISDGVNPPVLVVSAVSIVITSPGSQPLPEQAVEEARLTAEALQNGD